MLFDVNYIRFYVSTHQQVCWWLCFQVVHLWVRARVRLGVCPTGKHDILQTNGRNFDRISPNFGWWCSWGDRRSKDQGQGHSKMKHWSDLLRHPHTLGRRHII